MHVIATAGHVDHGKSTLVERLTGTHPDRLEAERRRGLSIELGYCWTSLDTVGEVAFVDVPGHERFVTTMLSGIGSVPAVLLVVAADDPWMPQAAEHLAALDAIGVCHGVVAVTRSDLADPHEASRRARREVDSTSLVGAPVVAVSARTGAGLEELRAALVNMLGSVTVPNSDSDVRLWIDRRFTVSGSGTVVTGTLPAGRIRLGDTLSFGDRMLRVRRVQSLGHTLDAVEGSARVALNVSGTGVDDLRRGDVLVSPGAWHTTDVVDVRLTTTARSSVSGHRELPPERPMMHIGATATAVHFRPLDSGHARLRFGRLLPLRVGDRALLRDPGSRSLWGITVLDPAPPKLGRRGARSHRAALLQGMVLPTTVEAEVERRGIVQRDLLRKIGVATAADPTGLTPGDGWLMSPAATQVAREQLTRAVQQHVLDKPLERGLPLGVAAARLALPSVGLVTRLVAPPLRVEDGRITTPDSLQLPPRLEGSLRELADELTDDPFAAPTAERLRELDLDTKGLAAAARVGRLVRLSPTIVLLPGAVDEAVARLSRLSQPFTASEARAALVTTRRVALPLLEHLDRCGRTRRLPDDRRVVCDGD